MILSILANILIYYSAFSIATAVTSYFTIYRPILKVLQKQGHELWEMDNPILTFFALTVISTILAPALIKHAIAGPSEEFIEAYVNTVLDQQK